MNFSNSFPRRWFTSVACAWMVGAMFAASAAAETPASLNLVPADAAFYSGTTHLREQYDSLMNSRAVAKLRQMPVVQMGLAMVQAQWNNPQGDYAPFKAMLDQPENQQLVDLLTDAVSHEIFVYGDEGVGEMLALLQEINQDSQTALRDRNLGNSQQPVAARLLQVLLRHLDDAKVPDMVIGFRLSDTEPALAQLTRLEQLLGAVLAGQPELKQRLSREKIAGGDFLTIQLDGSLIPWDQLPADPELDTSELQKKVSQMTASVAIGVKDDYLIVSIGDNNDHLASLGQGDVLASRKEMLPLEAHAQKQICSVGYASENFMKSINSAERQLGQLVTVAETLLPMSGLPDTVQQEIVGDVRGLVADIATVLPKPGAVMTFTFTTDRGYEGYSHNWGEINNVDASQPLTILEHVGGDPILMVAGRGKYSPDNYDMIAKWIGRAIYYGETIGVQFLGTKEQQFFQRVRGDLARLVKRLDTINREQLVPAFRDGQGAFVLDAKVSSKRWHELLPPTDEPLPMLEFGIVYGVSDAELVKQAAAGYFKVAQKIIDVLHEADPTTIPEFPLPAPESREFPDGTVYFYRLPKALGIDKQLSPNAGLSDDTLVLSLIPKTTVRLLRETPLVSSDLIGQHQQAAGAVVQFSLSRLLDAVSPWIGYGMTLSGEQVDDAILDQIQTGLEIASCLKEVTLVTYQADGAWVTHFETHIQDLP